MGLIFIYFIEFFFRQLFLKALESHRIHNLKGSVTFVIDLNRKRNKTEDNFLRIILKISLKIGLHSSSYQDIAL